jgi:hypothetical protein
MTSISNSHLLDDFYVLAVMTNPERFKRRPQLFREFVQRMDRYGVKLYIVEGAFGDREFEVTESGNPRHIQIRTDSEIWHKENLINIGISRLPSTWKYVAWIDGDIDFVHPNWALETIHELQHHPVVQMFEDAIDLGPTNEILQTYKSFAYCYKNNLPDKIREESFTTKKTKNSAVTKFHNYYVYCDSKTSPGTYWHPGYAWAATREAINMMGGLLDFGIVGAGDHHMACCLIGQGERSVPKGLHPNYKKMVMSWQSRALRLHKNIGFVKGTIYHYWHGKKRERKYKDRWQIVIDNKFDPAHDIHKDWQGLWSLYPGHEAMRDQIRQYFQSRNEDSVDKT